MRRRTVAAAAALTLLSSARLARAEDSVLVTGGTANDHDQKIVRTAAEVATRDDGWSLRATPLTRKEADSLLQCQDSGAPWTCIPSSLHASGSYHALILAIDNEQAENGAPMVVLTGKVIATDTHKFVGKRRFCVQCADDKLGAAATELTQELLRELAVREGHTVIEAHSTPQGAQISLDGRAVQVTDASLPTYPGKHVVVFEKPGFQPETREIVVERGKTADLTVVLQPISASGGSRTTARPSYLLPGALVALGAAGIGAGIVLYAIDQDPSRSLGKRYRDTASAGLAFGAVGLATAGVGALLWYRVSRATPAPSAAITHNSALITWGGSF